MAENFSYDFIGEHLKVAEGSGGWNLELNKVAWGDRPAKYDLRPWSPDHQKMGKGLTFTEEELKALKEKLSALAI